MKLFSSLRISALLIGVMLLTSRSVDLVAETGDFAIAEAPLFVGGNQPPLMMMVMSRDEQLFNKAYSDYTNLQEGEADDTGTIDTTYDNSFDYAGYFDPLLCYGYSSGMFKASGTATNHQCSGAWSGNFLNWVTMSRLDIIRHVLYGGMRSIDTKTQTVLERAPIPNDLHAWVKIYSGSDIAKYVPNGSGTMSFCNATIDANGLPLMRQAKGAFPQWAATSLYQCRTSRLGEGEPASSTDYTVRVDVCSNASARESVCRSYSDGSNTYYKPAGSLQEYGESGKLRFGLISGSYSQPRKGGVLRRNIGLFAGNDPSTTCATNADTGGIDEVDTATGQFCKNINGTSNAEGIIRTFDNFRLTNWNVNVWSDCNAPGILNHTMRDKVGGATSCIGWGNPLAEMYAEALRYVSGETTATSSFVNGASSDLAGLPFSVTWKDPYRSVDKGGNSYCATCNILVLSSGLPSFDSDNVPSVPNLDGAVAATTAVGAAENLSGNYFIGRTNGVVDDSSYADYCTSMTLGGLGKALGLCPDSPATEGSYLIAGLAHQARIKDIRASKAPAGRPSGKKNEVTTYAVQMAENLPSFKIPVGEGAITLSPLCQANTDAKATNKSGGWRTCFLGSVSVGTTTATVDPKYVYGRDLEYSGGKLVAGSYMLVWEDSMWGNDHDNDVVTMLSFCVGSFCAVGGASEPIKGGVQNICWRTTSTSTTACGRNPTNNEVLIRLETLSEYAGHSLLNGFTVTGSDSDGTKRDLLAPGGWFTSILTAQKDPPKNGDFSGRNGWDAPVVYRFKAGKSNTGVLNTPLWYAAKYGGFKDANGNNVPDGSGEWDSKVSGTPDNYFLARNPTKLKKALEEIFENATKGNAPTGAGASGARLNADSFTLDVTFNVPDGTNDWSGDVVAKSVTQDGSEGSLLWGAADSMQKPGSRNIYVVKKPTILAADGTVAEGAEGVLFEKGNIGWSDLGLGSKRPSWTTLGIGKLIAYLRGNQSNEQKSGGEFRNRTSPIGDIINSTPEIVSSKDDYGYGYWRFSTSPSWKKQLGDSYVDYLKAKANNPKPTVYVGANDGMLHAFDASKSGGREHFAFIPSVALGRMGELANPAYVHRYTVDGPIVSHDVPFNATSDWKTVLVTSTGAGGRSVSALDISDPGSFDDDSVLWELRGTDAKYSGEDDLGYVFGKPAIVPISGASATSAPRWVALFGNGINSKNGMPTLYVVDVKTGRVLKRLKPTNASYSAKNGLIGIAPVALYNTDGLVDTVYGGDMQGNVWKFDLSATGTTSWNVAFDGKPLFTAKDASGKGQPITGGFDVSRGPGGGVSVFFGTGQYFAIGDNMVPANPPVQSLYGVVDKCTSAACPAADRITGTRSDVLAERTITAGTTSSGYDTRNVSQGLAKPRGWFIDLKVGANAKGERFIGTPRLQNGKVFFTTFEPVGDDCEAGGRNWLYGLNLVTGSGEMAGVSTTPGGDAVCTGDCGGLALKNTGAPVRDTNILIPPPPPGQLTCPATDPNCLKADSLSEGLKQRQCTLVLRAPGAAPLYLPRPCGRQSWRQVR